MIETAPGAVLAVLWAALGVWFLLSAVNQFSEWEVARFLRRHDRLSFLPRWTFFAPNPAQADLRLLWRDEVPGVPQPWQEFRAPFAPRWRHWLFNPELVTHKALADLSGSLLQTVARIGEDPAMFSGPYIALLAVVMSFPAVEGAQAREFAVVRTSGVPGERVMKVAFISRPHAFPEASADARVR